MKGLNSMFSNNQDGSQSDPINPLKDSILFEGDLISPIDEVWDADS
jgi:hypothetical protein